MRKFLFLFIAFISTCSFAQDIKLDKLEMYYDQGHYKVVHRRAKRLLDNPEYDNSLVPAYYKSITTLNLYQDEKWSKRHREELEEAISFLNNLNETDKGIDLMERHVYELRSLEKDLNGWAADLKVQGKISLFNKIDGLIRSLFGSTKNNTEEEEKLEETNKELEEELKPTEELVISDKRKLIIENSKEQLGVPYVYAGSSPKGFDCSGFTSYIYKDVEVTLPRRASDQKAQAKKVKRKNVEIGDLVFFKKGSRINHVGIVISLNNGSIQMIHASSSIGISIVDIYTSKYWSERIDSFGRYL